MELKSLDVRFLSRGEEPLGPFATLATIDEKGLDAIGKWPWPRGKIAALIDPLIHCSVIHFAFCAALASQRTNEVEA